MPRDGGVHITPPPYAYSAHRGMRRVRIDRIAEAHRHEDVVAPAGEGRPDRLLRETVKVGS